MQNYSAKTRLFLCLLFPAFISSNIANAQHSSKKRWNVQKPFEQYCFIENKGQYPQQVIEGEKNPILYSTLKGKVHLFFTANSVVYRYDSLESVKDNDNKNEDADRDGKKKIVPYKFSMNWEGANPNPQVEVENPLSNYYTFPNPLDKSGKSGIKANAWSKLIYRNVYNGIDVEFYYPQDKGGIKYNVIVHPGADLASFKMKYNGAKVKLSDNNVIITAPFATFTDHAPVSSSNGNTISSSFSEKDNTVSFSTGSYDKSQFLTIDPWTTSTAFIGLNEAYDLDYDNQGNVYAIGGGNTVEYQIVKFNSTGVLQWTYSATFAYIYSGSYYLYSDLTVDHRNGTSYFAEGGDIPGGAQVLKVNSAGLQKGLFAGNSSVEEMWRLAFDYCNNKIIIGAGNPSGAPGPAQAGVLDTALTTITAVNVLGAFDYYHDMSLIALDGVGKAYMASSVSVLGGFDNQLLRLPLPTLSPTAYSIYDGHSFRELTSVIYYPAVSAGIMSGNGFNGMAANTAMVVTYDGKELKKWRASTGAYIDSISVSSTYFNWGGIDLDCKGNIYIGNNTSVNMYDSTLSPILSPISFTNTIYDLRVNNQGQIYVCGNGFVAADTIANSKMAGVSVVQPTNCKVCNGSATASACGTAPFTYLWSNGATTQTITNLCTGTYTVTITDAQCLPRKDTVVAYLGVAGYYATTSQVNPTCTKKGSATVNVFGGAPPYTYSWNTGDTTKTDTGLVVGTYTVTVTDTNGCVLVVTVRLTPPALPAIKIVPAVDSICPGGNINLLASGGSTYVWSPSSSLSCSTCTNPNATPTITTTYTVTATDTGGCVNTATSVISIAMLPAISVSPVKDSICPGGKVNLFASGGLTYTWLPAAGLSCTSCANTSASPTVKTTYTVTGTNALGCTNTSTTTITIIPVPKPVVSPSSDSICYGLSATLTVTGGTTYTWTPSTGLNTTSGPTVIATPTNTTTYVVTASNGSCTHDTTVVVKVLQAPGIKITNPLKICDGSTTTLTATGGGTYHWSNNQTTSSITVTPSVNTAYSVIVTGANGCKDSTFTSVGVDIPSLSVCCDTTIVKGTTVPFTTAGNVVGFVWTPGSGLSCYTCPDPKANPTSNTTYTVIGTDSAGCTVERTVTVDMKCTDFIVPNVFTPNGDNQNDLLVITISTIDTYNITIYDRWGVEMFTTNDAFKYWDGTTKKGEKAPSGVYYYIIKSTCGTNEYDKKGFVELIR